MDDQVDGVPCEMLRSGGGAVGKEEACASGVDGTW